MIANTLKQDGFTDVVNTQSEVAANRGWVRVSILHSHRRPELLAGVHGGRRHRRHAIDPQRGREQGREPQIPLIAAAAETAPRGLWPTARGMQALKIIAFGDRNRALHISFHISFTKRC